MTNDESDATSTRRRLLQFVGAGSVGSLLAEQAPGATAGDRTPGSAGVATGQPFEMVWTEEVTPTTSGMGSAFGMTYSGDADRFAITGWTNVLGDQDDSDAAYSADIDAFLAELTGGGNLTTRTVLSDTDTDWGGDVAPRDGGGYAVSFNDVENDDERLGVHATDGTGGRAWRRTFGSHYTASAGEIRMVQGGGHLFLGDRQRTQGADEEGRVFRVDTNGDLLWADTFGFGLHGLVRTTDDGYLVLGSGGNDPDNTNGLALKITDGGQEIWRREVQPETGTSLTFSDGVVTDAGGYVVCGETDEFAEGAVTVVALDQYGGVQWTRTYTDRIANASGSGVSASSILRLGSGRYLVGGTAYANPWRPWLFEIDGEGDVVWSESMAYEMGRDAIINQLVRGDGGEFVACGAAADTTNDDNDYDDSEVGGAVAIGFRPPNQPPTVSISVSTQSPAVGEEVTLTADTNDPDGRVTRVEWDLDGDGEFEKRGRRIAHTYSTTGTYEVTLRVTDDDGLSASKTKPVTVEPKPKIEFSDLRLVQTVEDTSVDSQAFSRTIANPDMVKNRPTSILFNVDGTNHDAIPDSATFQLSVSTDTGFSETITMPGSLVKALSLDYTENENPATVDEARDIGRAPADSRPPIFTLDEELSEVSVELGSRNDIVGGSSRELSAGSDFTVSDSTRLRIGFIELRAPRDSSKPPKQDKSLTGKWAYGNRNGGRLRPKYQSPGTWEKKPLESARAKFEKMVDVSRRYLERVYPVDKIEVRKYPATADGGGPIEGIKQGGFLSDLLTEYMHEDFRTARSELAAEFGDLDAAVVFVPDGYFLYHGDRGGGVEMLGWKPYSQPPTAACVKDSTDLGYVVRTVAQELGHHFEGQNLYTGKLRQRRDPDGDGQVEEKDPSHARTEDMLSKVNGTWTVIDRNELHSTSFDLFNDTYSVLREGGDTGYWGRHRDGQVGGQENEWKLGSFMSYNVSDDVWTDSVVFQSMIDDSISPTPSVSGPADNITMTLSGTAVLDDEGNVHLGKTSKQEARPMKSASKGDIKIAVQDSESSELDERRSPKSLMKLGHGGANAVFEETFVFQVPYPKETKEIVFEDEKSGTETRITPHGTVLKTAIGNVPDRGFESEPDDHRQDLLETAESFEEAVTAEEYDEARSELESLEADVEDWLEDDYRTVANQYTKTELLDLIDEQRSRIGAISKPVRDGTLSPLQLAAVATGAIGTAGYGLYRYISSKRSTPDVPEMAAESDIDDAGATGGPTSGMSGTQRQLNRSESAGGDQISDAPDQADTGTESADQGRPETDTEVPSSKGAPDPRTPPEQDSTDASQDSSDVGTQPGIDDRQSTEGRSDSSAEETEQRHQGPTGPDATARDAGTDPAANDERPETQESSGFAGAEFCPTCGTELGSDWVFCMGCGSELPDAGDGENQK